MKKVSKTIYFRADGNSIVGLGHITRCIALADMLLDDFQPTFLIQSPTEILKNQIQETFELIELPVTDDFLFEASFISSNILNENDLIVLDGYHFQTEYQKIIKSKSCRLVCIDDLHAWHFVADVVINHAGGIVKEDYSCESYTKLFLGIEYALLRKPFLEAAKKERRIDKIENVFICFGGADPNNVTLQMVIDCLKITFFKEIYVVVGTSYPHFTKLKERTALYPHVKIFQNLNSTEICNIMFNCQIGIVSASNIAYECLATGLRLIVGYYTDNQKYFFEYFVNQNYQVLGNLLDYDERQLFELLCKSMDEVKTLQTFSDNIIPASNMQDIFKEISI